MPSPQCLGSGMTFDCTREAEELRCPNCGRKVRIHKTSAWEPTRRGAVRQHRGTLMGHPPSEEET